MSLFGFNSSRRLAWVLVFVLAMSFALAAPAEQEGDEYEFAFHEEEDIVLPEYRINITKDELLPAEGLDANWLNILLLGTDTRSYELNTGRTDAMIVVSIHRVTGKVKLTSLSRDMWVDIYQRPAPNRINAAHSFGGPLLSIRTVNDVLGLNITKFISINFYGFSKAVEAIGGVDIPLLKTECTYINGKLPREPKLVYADGGDVHLNGAQALWYTRIRVLEGGTTARNERQRVMLMTLARKLMNDADPMTVLNVISSLLPCVSTNLPLTDILMIIQIVMNGGNFEFEAINLPAPGDFYYDEEDGVSKVIFKEDITQQKCLEFIYGD